MRERLLSAIVAAAIVACGDESTTSTGPATEETPPPVVLEPIAEADPEVTPRGEPETAPAAELPAPIVTDLLRTTPSWIVWPPCMGLDEPSQLFSVRVVSPEPSEIPRCVDGARAFTMHVPEDATVHGLRLVSVTSPLLERIAVCRSAACEHDEVLAELRPGGAVVSGDLELLFDAPGGDLVVVFEPATSAIDVVAIQLLGEPGATVRAEPRPPPEQIGSSFATSLGIPARDWVLASLADGGPGSVEALEVELTRRAHRETRIVAAAPARTSRGASPVTIAIVLRRSGEGDGLPLLGDLLVLDPDGSVSETNEEGGVERDDTPEPTPTPAPTPPGVVLRGPSTWLDGECEAATPRELWIVRITHTATGAVRTTSEVLVADDVCSPIERRLSLGDFDADGRTEVRARVGWTVADDASDAERARRTTEVILDVATFWEEGRFLLDDLDDGVELTAEAFLADLDADHHDDLSVLSRSVSDDGSVVESGRYFLYDDATDAWLVEPHFTAPAAPERVIHLARGFEPDPTVLGGTAGGPLAAASTLGAECEAQLATAPNHVLDVTLPFATMTLTVESPGDTVLVVRLADGEVLCDDDSAPVEGAEGDDARLVLTPLPPGRHEVWVGMAPGGAPAEYTLAVSETGAGVGAHSSTMTFTGVPRSCGMATADYGPLRVGMSVVLGTDTGWTGPDGHGGRVTDHHTWDDTMFAYVGTRTTITELAGLDEAGCPVVHVDRDGGRWSWRIRELRP